MRSSFSLNDSTQFTSKRDSSTFLATEDAIVGGVKLALPKNDSYRLTRLVTDHLDRDDASNRSISTFRQLSALKYPSPSPKDRHLAELLEIDMMLTSKAKLNVHETAKNTPGFFKVHRTPVGSRGRNAQNQGVGYFCFPFVAVSLFIRLFRARCKLQKRKDENRCRQVQQLVASHTRQCVFSRWRKAYRAEKWLQRTNLKRIIRGWSAVATRQRWARNIFCGKVERVIWKQYRLKRVFDVWRTVAWIARYLDATFLITRRNDERKPEIVTSLTFENFNAMEVSTDLAFQDRFGRYGSRGTPIPGAVSSFQCANILPESIRHVWEVVFSKKHWEEGLDHDVTEYTLLNSRGHVGFQGRVSREIAAIEAIAKEEYFSRVPKAWKGWREYVKRSKQMKATAASGEKFFATRTRLQIARKCLQKWHTSQQMAFAQTSFIVRTKYLVLNEWRKRLVQRLTHSDLLVRADSFYKKRMQMGLMAQWKDRMRRSVILQVVGTTQALLHRREMLVVLFNWQARYYARRAEERNEAITQQMAFKSSQHLAESADLLTIQSSVSGTEPCVRSLPGPTFKEDGSFADSLSEENRICALQIKAFVAWRKLAQDAERYRVFANHHVDTCGKLLALRAFYVWRARGMISWTAFIFHESSESPLDAAGSATSSLAVGRVPICDLIALFSKKIANITFGISHKDVSSVDAIPSLPSTIPHRANGTPLSPALGGSLSPGSSHLLAVTSSSQTNVASHSATKLAPVLSLYGPFQWQSVRAAVSAYLAILFPSEISNPKQTPSTPYLDAGSPAGRSMRSPANSQLEQSSPLSASMRRSPAFGQSGLEAVSSQRPLLTVGVASANIVAFGCVPGITAGVPRLNLLSPLDSRFVSQLSAGEDYAGRDLTPSTSRGSRVKGSVQQGFSLGGSVCFRPNSPSVNSLQHSEGDAYSSTAMTVILSMLQDGGLGGSRGDLLLLKARLESAQYRAFARFTQRSSNGEVDASIMDVPNPQQKISQIAQISRRIYREEVEGIVRPFSRDSDSNPLPERKSTAPASMPMTPPMHQRTRSVTINEAASAAQGHGRPSSPARESTFSQRVSSPRTSYSHSSERVASPSNQTLHNRGAVSLESASQDEEGVRRARLDQHAIDCNSVRLHSRGVFTRYLYQRVGYAFVVMGISVQQGRKRRSNATLVFGNRHKTSAAPVRPWWESLGLRFYDSVGSTIGQSRYTSSGLASLLPSSQLGDHPTSNYLLSAYSTTTSLEADLITSILNEQERQDASRKSRRDWLFGTGFRGRSTLPKTSQTMDSEYFSGHSPKLISLLLSNLKGSLLNASRFESSQEERNRVEFLVRHPEHLTLYLSTDAARDRSNKSVSASDCSGQSCVDREKVSRVALMALQQLAEGLIDTRAYVWKPILVPVLEYFERNYKQILKRNPNVLASIEEDREQWATLRLNSMQSISWQQNETSIESTQLLQLLMNSGREGAFSKFFRDASSGLLVGEILQLMLATEDTRRLVDSQNMHENSPSSNKKTIDSHTFGTRTGDRRSVVLLADTLNNLICYHRGLTIRARMRNRFLLQRYRLAAAATRYVQHFVTGGSSNVELFESSAKSSTTLCPTPPPSQSNLLNGHISTVHTSAPHYTPHDALTGSRIAPVNPTKIAWNTESPQFKRRQFSEYHHYTIRTSQQAEHQQQEEEVTYFRILEKAQRIAREESRIANAKGSLAARLRMKGKKSRVGGAVMGSNGLPFLNTLLERYKPGASGSPRIVSSKLVFGNEDSEDVDTEDDVQEQVGRRADSSFSIITPTMPKGKVRKLMMVRKGVAQGLGDPSVDLEELKKTNPRMYYHQMYTARSGGTVAAKRDQMMDMFKESGKLGPSAVRTIGLVGQHIALEIAIKWRLRLEVRMFEKKLLKKNAKSREEKDLVDEDDLHGCDENPAERYWFKSSRMRFLFLA